MNVIVGPAPRLDRLPPELLDKIVLELGSARSLAILSRTSRPLQDYATSSGWRIFVRHHFPSLRPPQKATPGSTQNGRAVEDRLDPCVWRDTAHSVTSALKAWERRAFQASGVGPDGEIWNLKPDVPERPPSERRHLLDPKPEANGLTNGSLPIRGPRPSYADLGRPSVNVRAERKASWERPRGQTLGFTPCIDSYEYQTGSRWVDKRQLLVWSAGAELLLQVNDTATPSGKKYFVYRPPGAVEGVDDISSVNLIKPDEGHAKGDGNLDAIISTVAGNLQHCSFRTAITDEPYSVLRTEYNTSSRPVRDVSLHNASTGSDDSLISAVLDNSVLALYRTNASTESHDGQARVDPLSEVDVTPGTKGKSFRIWSTTFLNSTTIATGQGPSDNAIRLYTVTPSGIVPEPSASIGTITNESEGTELDGQTGMTKTVYPIAPLWDGDGRVFASGGYDGGVRIHDIRDPNPTSYTLGDNTQQTAIYSLLPRPNHRMIAGASQHNLLKIFDLRHQPSIRSASALSSYFTPSYCYTSSVVENPSAFQPHNPSSTSPSPTRHVASQSLLKQALATRGNFNIFTRNCPNYDPPPQPWSNPRGGRPRGRGRQQRPVRRQYESNGPVYSLSSPSPYSPIVYVGLEDAVTRLCFSSTFDETPDPVLVASGDWRGLGRSEKEDLVGKTTREREIAEESWRLSMYENDVETERGMDLERQVDVGEAERWRGRKVGLDARWGEVR